ncbi:hypothetical protein HAX54_005007 [Datura stramonium]|uniref:Uncharacterized protein n=1 Tax=Datura stramonium TaxID=4076 RepID=A0ABS8RTY6_DATST|nr:hypothetical protein [Datura stramonium]
MGVSSGLKPQALHLRFSWRFTGLDRRFAGDTPSTSSHFAASIAGGLHLCPVYYLKVAIDRRFAGCDLRSSGGSQLITSFPGTLVETGGSRINTGIFPMDHQFSPLFAHILDSTYVWVAFCV